MSVTTYLFKYRGYTGYTTHTCEGVPPRSINVAQAFKILLLEKGIPQDVIRYCIQPFLLPENGMTMKEKVKKICDEIWWTVNEWGHGYMREPFLHALLRKQRDERSGIFRPKLLRTIAIMNVGSYNARLSKWCLIRNLQDEFSSQFSTPIERGAKVFVYDYNKTYRHTFRYAADS